MSMRMWYCSVMARIISPEIERFDVSAVDITPKIKSPDGRYYEAVYNPSIARIGDKLWITYRACFHQDNDHPSHYTNDLLLGELCTKTLKPTVPKIIKDVSCHNGFEKFGIEDVRLFEQADGSLAGIGVGLEFMPGDYRAHQVSFTIDTEKLVTKNRVRLPRPRNLSEKNWSPPTVPARMFDYTYSPSEVVVDGDVVGGNYNSGPIHGGSQLLPYTDERFPDVRYISFRHCIFTIRKVSTRVYAQVATLHNKWGITTHRSQFFYLNMGWRPQLTERIELIYGVVDCPIHDKCWLVSFNYKDENSALGHISHDMLKFEEYDYTERYYWPAYVTEPTDTLT
jgi:hypothetical protein